MDIGSIVQYDALYTLDLLHPVTDEPLGITFQIRSAESDVAKRMLRKHLDENSSRRQKGKIVKFGTIEQQELEKAASLIASWDWGEHTYNGVVPELSIETAVEILDKEGWIYSQVMTAASTIANFSTTPGKASAKP